METVASEGGAHPAPPGIAALQRRVAVLAELPIGDLQEAWTGAWGVPPPKGARRQLMMLGIAGRWQAEMQGGLVRQLERRLAALEAQHRQSGAVDVSVAKKTTARRLMPGNQLIRVWGDARHEVIVTETGFLWRGRELDLALGHRPRNHRLPPQRPGLLRPARR